MRVKRIEELALRQALTQDCEGTNILTSPYTHMFIGVNASDVMREFKIVVSLFCQHMLIFSCSKCKDRSKNLESFLGTNVKKRRKKCPLLRFDYGVGARCMLNVRDLEYDGSRMRDHVE